MNGNISLWGEQQSCDTYCYSMVPKNLEIDYFVNNSHTDFIMIYEEWW